MKQPRKKIAPDARLWAKHRAILQGLATKHEKHIKVSSMLEKARDADRRNALQQELSQIHSHMAGVRPIAQHLMMDMGRRAQLLHNHGIRLPSLPLL
jgi:hypothetical protein